MTPTTRPKGAQPKNTEMSSNKMPEEIDLFVEEAAIRPSFDILDCEYPERN